MTGTTLGSQKKRAVLQATGFLITSKLAEDHDAGIVDTIARRCDRAHRPQAARLRHPPSATACPSEMPGLPAEAGQKMGVLLQ